MALPHVEIGVLVRRLKVLHLIPQDFREPGVVLPVDLPDLGIRRGLGDETPVGLVRIKLRVEAHPYFRGVFPDRGNQGFPARLTHILGFLNPATIYTFVRPYVLGVMPQTYKREITSRPSIENGGLLDFIGHAHVQRFDLIREQLVNAVLDGVLKLPRAENT